MNSPVYTFGPHAPAAIALSLKDALADTFPSFSFDVEMMSTLDGFKAAVVLKGSTKAKAWERMIMFSRGFVAGFGGGIEPTTRQQAVRRTMTRADCPAAKRKSDPPPPDSTPTRLSRPAPKLPVRRRTLLGIPPPRRD
jgi:hypothetical protein